MQRRIVELGIVGQSYDGGSAVRLDSFHRFVGPVVAQRHAGEPVLRGKGGAGVDDGDGISRKRGHGSEELADMNCADNNHSEWWIMHVSEMRVIRADTATVVPHTGECFVYLSVGETERPSPCLSA